MAKGNIIVSGEVKGACHAGCEGLKSAYVVANSFDTTEIKIAGHGGDISSAKKSFFRRPHSTEPMAVVLWEGVLLKEALSAGILKKLVS